ncbi:MAG: hypothetical protein QM831_37900 [Kofleriaceae bacterium]
MRYAWLVCVACGSPAHPQSDRIVIDRFSAAAGHLMVRGEKKLPEAGAPIDFDHPPFITQALGPDGGIVRYYNFDVQSDQPATLYRPTHGKREAIPGALDIVDVIPGDHGYSDFFQIVWVTIPDGVTPKSASELASYPQDREEHIIDCPVVPHGSTAKEGNGVAPAVPTTLWYRGQPIDCLRFGDPLPAAGTKVPTSPIYVTFAHEQFKTVDGSVQTHNVVLSVPGDTDYSPLWDVHIYDERAFDLVRDAATAQKARLVKPGPLVNCPVVTVKPAPV